MGDSIQVDAVHSQEANPSSEGVKTSSPEPPTKCSKRQAKRLESYVHRKEVRRQIRKAYKERRKQRKQLAREFASGESSDSSAPLVAPPDPVLSRRALSHVPPMSASSCTTKVVIDCAYDHLMSFKDLCKLANQICNCYAINRRSAAPVQLYVTGLSRSANATAHLSEDQPAPTNVRLYDRLRIAGCDHWDINLCDQDYTELFPSDSIVYLCAESPFRLPDTFSSVRGDTTDPAEFSTADVYVIGGLVDHNHRVGYCFQQAKERSHRTARLPIAESGMVLNGRHVLSTVQVFQALAPVLAGNMTWAESLNTAVPPRKTVRAANPPS